MTVLPIKINHTLRRSTAVTLVIWLVGFGCLVGCELNVSAAPAAAIVVMQADGAESCPMNADGHDCCQQAIENGDELSFGRLPHSKDKTACCPLLDEVADPARKIRIVNARPAAIMSEVFFAPEAHAVRIFSGVHLRVPDRGSTFLHVCVFRI